MIGVTLGASPAARPFYNHGPAGPAPIVRTLLAFDAATNGAGIVGFSGTIAGTAATDTVICGVVMDQQPNSDVSVDIAGRVFNLDNSRNFSAGSTYVLIVWSLRGAGVAPNGAYNVDFSGSAIQPTNAAFIMIGVSGLEQGGGYLDQIAANNGASGTQDSGLTPATTHARDFVCGMIGTVGNGVDALGAWQAGLAAGKRINAVAADLKEGFAAVAATGQQRSEVTGATVRAYASLCTVYKGA